jgi:hypothetical protein
MLTMVLLLTMMMQLSYRLRLHRRATRKSLLAEQT